MVARAKIKQLYKGYFSYRCELQKEFAYAYTEKQAKFLMMQRLAKKHEVSLSCVCSLFDGSQPNFKIELEMEVTEDG